MIRQVIEIDEEKCNGCGLCARACHEGAIGMIDGKARLLRDDFCDGMGDCLPACPADAITFVEREALPYDERAVARAKGEAAAKHAAGGGGCPGSRAQTLHVQSASAKGEAAGETAVGAPSRLAQWPCQIKLLPVQAPYYQGVDLLIAADCTAFSYASFHERFMAGKITAIGCPKLDAIDYAEKLASIIALNDVRGVTVCRMEVPCCGGIERAAQSALAASGKNLPFEVVTFSVRGEIL